MFQVTSRKVVKCRVVRWTTWPLHIPEARNGPLPLSNKQGTIIKKSWKRHAIPLLSVKEEVLRFRDDFFSPRLTFCVFTLSFKWKRASPHTNNSFSGSTICSFNSTNEYKSYSIHFFTSIDFLYDNQLVRKKTSWMKHKSYSSLWHIYCNSTWQNWSSRTAQLTKELFLYFQEYLQHVERRVVSFLLQKLRVWDLVTRDFMKLIWAALPTRKYRQKLGILVRTDLFSGEKKRQHAARWRILKISVIN